MPFITLILPVRNDNEELTRNFPKIYKYMSDSYGRTGFEIIIAEGGSTDSSKVVAQKLSELYEVTACINLSGGRGFALKQAIKIAKGWVIGYTDIDLPVPLGYISKAAAAIRDGSEVVIGSRYAEGSKTKRDIIRLILSSSYNYLIRLIFQTGIYDHQCGFKFWKGSYIKRLAGKIKDDRWFFDTEMIIIARKDKARIFSMPIEWNEREYTSSKVKLSDIFYFIKAIIRELRIAKES